MQTVTYSDARADLKAVLDKVVADRAPTLITRQRGEDVVMIAASEWAGMEETLHLLASPANARHLLEGIARLDAGGGEEHELCRMSINIRLSRKPSSIQRLRSFEQGDGTCCS